MRLQFCHLLIFPVLIFSFAQCAAVKELKLENQNEEIVRNWLEEGWNNNRWEELIPVVFAEDWEDGNPIRPDQNRGVEGMKEMVQFYQQAFANPYFDITHLFGSGNFVAARYNITATHTGPYLGIKPSGRKITTTGMVIFELKDGKIRRTYAELDLAGVLNQIKS